MRTNKRTQPSIAAIGIDLGDVWGHYCFIDGEGELLKEGRVKMTQRALSDLFAELSPTRIAIEVGHSRCG